MLMLRSNKITKRLAILLFLTLPSQALANNWQDSITRADDDCAKLARACSAAAIELTAARKLIEGLEAEIAATDERIKLARLEIESLKQLAGLERERSKELQAVIDAEREAKELLLKKIQAQTERIASLEKKLSRSRRLNLIAGVAAAVGIVIALAK
jgi:predicted RNase H-like nuclease (RuvC/YqgF family)